MASGDEIPEDSAKQVEIGGRRIAVFNVEGTFHTIDNTCTHDDGPLAGGRLEGHEVTRPWHGAVLDVRTGEILGPPAGKGGASYPVRVQASDLEVAI